MADVDNSSVDEFSVDSRGILSEISGYMI
uniref:Uncharacterized protein n=1 Tax=Rhizophora mucronata TaxID=61149 RepID=A0A2P2J122_RHIMU